MATVTVTLPAWLAPLYTAAVGVEAQTLWTIAGAIAFLALVRLLWHSSVPDVKVPLEPDELPNAPPAPTEKLEPGRLACHDPATGDYLGSVPCESSAAVEARVQRARAAQAEWASTSFATRRRLLKIISKCVLDHASDICRISARDSGKTTTDAAFGEVLVTLEKLCWLCAEGEAALKPEWRSPGRMLFYKVARVEWHPRGVLGAIVPWNYPFHNILNPVSAAVFSGNAISSRREASNPRPATRRWMPRPRPRGAPASACHPLPPTAARRSRQSFGALALVEQVLRPPDRQMPRGGGRPGRSRADRGG